MEEIMEKIGAKIEIVEIKRIRKADEKEKEMVVVKQVGEEQKGEVLRKKSSLKGTEESILEDWTWREG